MTTIIDVGPIQTMWNIKNGKKNNRNKKSSSNDTPPQTLKYANKALAYSGFHFHVAFFMFYTYQSLFALKVGKQQRLSHDTHDVSQLNIYHFISNTCIMCCHELFYI